MSEILRILKNTIESHSLDWDVLYGVYWFDLHFVDSLLDGLIAACAFKFRIWSVVIQYECVNCVSVSDFYNVSFFDDHLVNFSILSDGTVQADNEVEVAKVRRGEVLPPKKKKKFI